MLNARLTVFDPKRPSLWLSICAATCATIGSNPLQKTRCGYFRAEETLPCNKRKPGSGCSALNGINDKHAIFGWSEACVATQPSDPATALAALDAIYVTAHRDASAKRHGAPLDGNGRTRP
jgi:xanthine dehydrogenase YagS FAD-binding subunit